MGEFFLLLQQRSKHPREMVVTPKASISSLAQGEAVGGVLSNFGFFISNL